MKKHFYSLKTALVALSLPILGYGQQISSLTVIPDDPIGTSDVVSVIAEAWHSSSGCPIVNTQISQSQDTIYVEVIHDLGLALAICDSKDTTAMGTFDQGTYTVAYLMTSGVFGDDSVTDTAYTEFTVDGVNSTSNRNKEEDLNVYPNPSKDFFEISTEQRGLVNLFDAQGRVVKSIVLKEKSTRVFTSELDPGMYILKMNRSAYSKGVRVLIE
ncbi:MAG: T9SS type A sorting domain-containing protein [Bacteroidota bacterium]